MTDQIIEIKRNEQLLKAKLAEVDQLPAGEIRPQPSEKRRTVCKLVCTICIDKTS
jgi:hypothetical protein